jgi:hypothetical protein
MDQHKPNCAIPVDQYFRYLHGLIVEESITGESANLIWPEVLSALSEPLASSWSAADDTLVESGSSLLQIGVVTDVLKLTSARITKGYPFHVDDARKIATTLHLFLIMTSPPRDPHQDHTCPQYYEDDVLSANESHFIASCTGWQQVSLITSEEEDHQSALPKFHLVTWLIRKQDYNPPLTVLQCLSKVVRGLVTGRYPWDASYGIDILFRYLLERDHNHPYSYPDAPFDLQAQERKLWALVDILAHELEVEGPQAHWEVLLGPWCMLLRERYYDFLKGDTESVSGDDTLPGDRIQVPPETDVGDHSDQDSGSAGHDAQWPFALRPLIEPDDQVDRPNRCFYLGKLLRYLDYLRRRYTPLDSHGKVGQIGDSDSVRPPQFTELDAEIQKVGAAFSFLNRHQDATESLLELRESNLALNLPLDSQV